MAKITLVGSYPPNYGGISTHVQRLHMLLARSNECRVKDLYSAEGDPAVEGVDRIYGGKVQRVLRCSQQLSNENADLEHFHVSAMRKFLWSTPLLLGRKRQKKRVLTIHGGAFPDVVAAFSAPEKVLFRWMLRQFDHFVCVSEKQREVLNRWEVDSANVSVINAYLPPIHSPRSGMFSEVEAVQAKGQQVLVCAAQYLEHYGIEELTAAMLKLEQDLGERTPVLALISYAEVDTEYQDRCVALREKLKTAVIEYQNLNPEKIAELMALGDCFVRPTWWDGDAISVREAAFFGNRLIASDVTTRPDGTVLFRSKDVDSLVAALKTVVEEPEAGLVEFDHQQSLRELAQVYENLGANLAVK